MNILVTGANGQLGRCFQNIISKAGNGKPDHCVNDKNYWIFAGHDELDITDADAVKNYMQKKAISVIVNCAAYTNVDKAESDKENAFKINADGAKNLAEACKNSGAVLIHISTDYVFSGAKNTPYTPNDVCWPTSVYGHSKRTGEYNIINSGCKYLIFRTSWLYSIYGKNFFTKMVEKFNRNEEIKVVYDQVGSPTSAYSLADYIYEIIENNDADNRYLYQTGIYHFANKGVASWYDMTMMISNFLGKHVYIEPCLSSEWKTPVERPHYSVLDTSQTEKTFNHPIYHWTTELDSVVEECINFMTKNDDKH